MSEPASIRYKNPGAMWGGARAIKWGAENNPVTLNDGLGQHNNIAVFPTFVAGICAQLDLWRSSANYRNKPFKEAIATWSGGNSVASYVSLVTKRVPGMTSDTIMNEAFWQSSKAIPFLKAQAFHEAGKEYPAPDADWQEAYHRVMGAAGGAGDPPVQPTAPVRPNATQVATAPKSFWQSLIESLLRVIFKKPAPVAAPAAPTPTPAAPVPTGTPVWFAAAVKDIGFKEKGENQGIEEFIDEAHTGNLGDPWCAIFVNAKLEECGIPGTRSAMARSFENHKNFVRLDGPARGAISTFWRGSKASGSGHVDFYAGTTPDGRNVGVGGNQSDSVNAAYMDMVRHTGWWWPAGQPRPTIGPVAISGLNAVASGKET